ncbi:SOS response-associated peptidase [Xanthovirga aplysinae]|uniref:SOS response-associated peptidase n=1 Tax=Xanthovirga aplysinae TaxID=2529853 RepID=UPI001FE8068B|nr:SOS response-associated peptidase [Xanthovirga aplysinae]
MCFHYSLQVEALKIEDRYQAHFVDPEGFQPFFYTNGYDHQALPVITSEASGEIQRYYWGLIPSWVKDRDSAIDIWSKTLNARSESAFEKPSFRHAIRYNRCLIPCTGFYEWHDYKGKKYPYFIQLKGNAIFSIAGIWEEWIERVKGTKVNTFSVLTTDANPMVAKIHNIKKRMPVILPVEKENRWLDPECSREEISAMLCPYEKEMEAQSISKLITARNENPNQEAVQKPFHYLELDLPDIVHS